MCGGDNAYTVTTLGQPSSQGGDVHLHSSFNGMVEGDPREAADMHIQGLVTE